MLRFARLALVLAVFAATNAASVSKTQLDVPRKPMTIERRSLTHTAAPIVVQPSQLAIYLQWDVTQQQDLDSILFDTITCLTCMKVHTSVGSPPPGGAGPTCRLPVPPTEYPPTKGADDDDRFAINYEVSHGGSAFAFESTVYPFGNPQSTLDVDSKYNTPTNAVGAAGVELILINDPVPGFYHHFVYNAGNPTYGFRGASGIRVDLWQLNAAGVAYSTPLAIDAPTPAPGLSTCYGRYWNTFTLHIKDLGTPGSLLNFNVTWINTITSSPLTSMGTNASQVFEDFAPRNNVGCV